MNVLVGVATYPTEPAVYARTQASLERLAGGATVRLYGDDDPALSAYDNLTAKHNRMRQEALDGDFEALLTIEADMVVPSDALLRLWEVDADVVYGLYASRTQRMLICFPQIDGYSGRSITASPNQWRNRLAAGEVVASEGAGFGCTLIRRSVLERVTFRRATERKARPFADDWPFALDVKAAGFKSAHHLGVQCGHICRNGDVLWPDAEAPRLVRVEPAMPEPEAQPLPEIGLYRVRRMLSGPSGYHKPGTLIELEREAAGVLLERRVIQKEG